MQLRPYNYLNKYITLEDDVLDICCGIGRLIEHIKDYKSITGVDIFYPYIERYRQLPRSIPVCMDIMDFIGLIDKDFDIILAMDAVEHLEVVKAVKLIEWIEKHFKKHLFILTPNKFINNKEAINSYGMAKNIYQEHLSFFNSEYWINRGYMLLEKYKVATRTGAPNYFYIKSI